MSTLRRVVKPSVLRINSDKQLREIDLKPSSVFLSPLDADLGSVFQEKLKAEEHFNALYNFLKELLAQYQLRLAASLDMLDKLEILSPKSVMSDVSRPAFRDLPMEFFSCRADTLWTQWRNVMSAGFSSELTIDTSGCRWRLLKMLEETVG